MMKGSGNFLPRSEIQGTYRFVERKLTIDLPIPGYSYFCLIEDDINVMKCYQSLSGESGKTTVVKVSTNELIDILTKYFLDAKSTDT